MKEKLDRSISVVSINSRDRSSILISTFPNGYTSEWKFKLPDAFRDELDIKLTPMVINGVTKHIFTQGNIFSFKAGDIIYDSALAYRFEWNEALKHIEFAIQVTAESFNSNLETGPLQINLNKFDDGHVSFKLMKNSNSTLEFFKSFETTQNEFVRFLQQGQMITSDSVHISLEDLRIEAYPNILSIGTAIMNKE